MHYFEDITSLIFCTALSDYDRMEAAHHVCQVQISYSITISHDGCTTKSRMAESIVLFDSLINSPWFSRSSIILFLNKIDIFRHKLPRVSSWHHLLSLL